MHSHDDQDAGWSLAMFGDQAGDHQESTRASPQPEDEGESREVRLPGRGDASGTKPRRREHQDQQPASLQKETPMMRPCMNGTAASSTSSPTACTIIMGSQGAA